MADIRVTRSTTLTARGRSVTVEDVKRLVEGYPPDAQLTVSLYTTRDPREHDEVTLVVSDANTR